MAEFQDPDFAPEVVGEGFYPAELGLPEEQIGWKGLAEILGGEFVVFRGGVEDIQPSDIKQGYLGDCWLVSSMSCLAEFPKCIMKLFPGVTTGVIDSEVLKVKLYDPRSHEWVEIEVYDEYPVILNEDGEPEPLGDTGMMRHLFADPWSREGWVMVIEKAVAKLLGGYEKINGGLPSFAFTILTGKPPETFWARTTTEGDPCWYEVDINEETGGLQEREEPELLMPEDMYTRLMESDQEQLLLAAGTYSKDEAPFGVVSEGEGMDQGMMLSEDGSSTGLFPSHAYSIIQVKEVEGFKLLQLRNPHGPDGREWQLAWGDNSSTWEENPAVAEELGYSPTSGADGLFWMAWEDFSKYFSMTFLLSKESLAEGFD